MHENDKQSTTRRQFVAGSSVLLAGGMVTGSVFAEEDSSEKGGATVKIGIVTDLHFADKATAGTRHYRESRAKLQEAVTLFKEQGVDFVVELGDIVDAASTVEQELSYLKTIDAVIKSSGVPVHYVLGNHCVATLTKEEFLNATGKEDSYYSFDLNGVHFVVLDACFNKDMKPYGRDNFVWTDTNIPQEEQEWLVKDLEATVLPVIVFAHQRLDLEPASSHAVKQSPQVRAILEKSGKITAVFQGHSHENELKEVTGIPYCTLAAMVEGRGKENSAYGILEVSGNGKVKLTGYRKQSNRTFPKV
ncbi:MAG: putative phosphodiesterase [Verrucomicrobiales bacterium]|jgi:predicted phosphodiesterase